MDAAVFRASSSTWYANKSGGGTLIQQFGIAGVPVRAAFSRDDLTFRVTALAVRFFHA